MCVLETGFFGIMKCWKTQNYKEEDILFRRVFILSIQGTTYVGGI